MSSTEPKSISYEDVDNNKYPLIYYSHFLYNKIHSNLRYYNILSNDFDANEIIEGLYLGSLSAVYNYEHLKQNNITHIISIIPGFTPPYPNDFEYMIVNALDDEQTNLFNVFEKTNKFINKAYEENGKILVHCAVGRSRSATIVCAYIIDSFGMNVDYVLNVVKEKRNIVEPNSSFLKQLQEYYNSKFIMYP